MLKNIKNLINEIPKCDLHVHLDGSIRLNSLIDLCKQKKIELPSYTEEGLKELIYKETYNDLTEYLKGFYFPMQVMNEPEILEQIAYEFAQDNIKENVVYVEVRFAPQKHVNKNMSIYDVIYSVDKGLNKAKEEYNNSYDVKNNLKPKFSFGIIACAMRSVFQGENEYFDKFLEVHSYSPDSRRNALASYELVLAMIDAREKGINSIVGFDLAGAEAGYPAVYHKEAYALAHRHFFKKTVHAGEAYGPESIFQAITDLYADRIGHGYYLFSEEMINSSFIKNKKEYINKLVQYIADRRITIEVCLTSNMQTNPKIKTLKNHSFKKMLENNLSTCICTDNRTVSRTTMSKELLLAYENFNLSLKNIKDLMIYGFKRNFYPGTYLEKRNYVHDIIDFYDKTEAKYKL